MGLSWEGALGRCPTRPPPWAGSGLSLHSLSLSVVFAFYQVFIAAIKLRGEKQAQS